ncbi:MAG: hypothetical protein MZV70_33115 [Desulfobacterales bacterium]|nr:hypothetical protein [Desulfobacterales bacterium]
MCEAHVNLNGKIHIFTPAPLAIIFSWASFMVKTLTQRNPRDDRGHRLPVENEPHG